MNRREFLAAGLGALSLAGKGLPPKPSFTVEMTSDKIWVNGKSPDKAWSHDEGMSRVGVNFKDLVVGGVKIESLEADTNDTCGQYRDKGTDVVMVNSKGTFRGKITECIAEQYGIAKPFKVVLKNGETLEVGEGQFFYRIEYVGR